MPPGDDGGRTRPSLRRRVVVTQWQGELVAFTLGLADGGGDDDDERGNSDGDDARAGARGGGGEVAETLFELSVAGLYPCLGDVRRAIAEARVVRYASASAPPFDEGAVVLEEAAASRTSPDEETTPPPGGGRRDRGGGGCAVGERLRDALLAHVLAAVPGAVGEDADDAWERHCHTFVRTCLADREEIEVGARRRRRRPRLAVARGVIAPRLRRARRAARVGLGGRRASVGARPSSRVSSSAARRGG